MLVRTTLRGPKSETRGGNIAYWTTPLIIPYAEVHKPIDAGLIPSPPNSTDVDQTNGISAIEALVRSASIPWLAIEVNTGLARTARSGGGPSVSFSDNPACGEVLASSSPAGSEVVPEGRLVRGPRFTV